MSGKLVIHGDSRSGNCLKVSWTADLLGLDYEWVETDIMKGESRTDEFLKLNPSGQTPTVVLPDGRPLAQSNAIILHLAELKNSALVPDDPYERAKVHEWLFWEQYSHEPFIAVRRFLKVLAGKHDDEIDPKLLARGTAALARMELALGEGPYLVGAALTVADIALVAYTRVAPEAGFDLEDFPNVRAWIARVERDLSLNPAAAPVEAA